MQQNNRGSAVRDVTKRSGTTGGTNGEKSLVLASGQFSFTNQNVYAGSSTEETMLLNRNRQS